MKSCDECGKREAVFSFTVVESDGTSRASSLCRECAETKGMLEKKMSIAEIFADLLKEKTEPSTPNIVCPDCSLSYAEFKIGGRLGCGRCYTAFAPALTDLIRRIQGSALHRGKIPSTREKNERPDERLRRLRAALDHAITLEDFEKAAAIRDQLDRYDPERN